MPIEAPQIATVSVGETRNVIISFDSALAAGETITGTPTAVEQTTADLTITSVAATVAEQTVLKDTVAAGRAVTFAVSGGLAAGSPYTIAVTISTTEGQTIISHARIAWV